MTTKNPKNEEEWKEFHKQNRKLAAQIKKAGKTYHYLGATAFKNTLADLTQEQLKEKLAAMRSEREFYKKIINEAYYKDKPEKKETSRYEDAMLKYNSINSKGKIVLELINK